MKYLTFTMLLLVSLLTNAQLNDTLTKALLSAEFDFWRANNDSSRFITLLEKAKIYRQADLYQQALNETNRAENYALSNTEKSRLKYERLLNNFLNNDYGYCTTAQFDSSEKAEHPHQIELIELYSLNETENWKRCKAEMINLLGKTDSAEQKKVLSLPESYHYKNPDKSKRLAAFLPGLGEIYAGYPIKGLTSFALNAGFLAFGAYNFYWNYYVTGFVAGIFPMTKFYGGGKRLSMALATRHNMEKSNRIKKQYSAEILSILK
jgi:hypothetical protein